MLGPVEAVRDGEVLRLGGRRQRALLALLLLDPERAVSSDRLVEDCRRTSAGSPVPAMAIAEIDHFRDARECVNGGTVE